MSTLLKYCDCPDPTEIDQQFCDTCGREYQDTPLAESTDKLGVGAKLGAYQVVERQSMWALLEDVDGERFRFWPTGASDGQVEAEPQPVTSQPTDTGVVTEGQTPDSSGEDEEPTPGTGAEEVAASLDPAPEVPAEPLDEKPAEEEFRVQEHSSDIIRASAEPLMTSEQEEVLATDDHDLPLSSVTPPPAGAVHLHHFTFLRSEAVTLGGISGYLEPARPPKFTGKEVFSLRALLKADPAGADRQPTRMLGWLVQCAQAMKSAHEQGILVNSFTPDTIFIDHDHAATRPERIAISTSLHAAPFDRAHRVAEYAPQGDEPLTPRTDVYQVGALLRDLMGCKPDQSWSENPEGLFEQPMSLVRLLLGLMHPDPMKRPADAEALKKVLVDTQQALASQHVLDVAGVTDTGLNREHNEDAFGFIQFEEQAGRGQLTTTVLVVCDGVGGSNAGEEASRLAVREVLSALSTSADITNPIPKRLEDAVLQANKRLLTLSAEHKGAGCTIVIVYIQGQEYWVAHTGDSRAYVCVRNVLRPLTEDHSWTAQQVRKGLLTGEEAREHANAHMIYRSLGERERLEVEIQPPEGPGFPLEAGSVFLLCTDGVTDVLDNEQLQGILSTNQSSPRAKAQDCVRSANAAGGPDNITALIAIQENSA